MVTFTPETLDILRQWGTLLLMKPYPSTIHARTQQEDDCLWTRHQVLWEIDVCALSHPQTAFWDSSWTDNDNSHHRKQITAMAQRSRRMRDIWGITSNPVDWNHMVPAEEDWEKVWKVCAGHSYMALEHQTPESYWFWLTVGGGSLEGLEWDRDAMGAVCL